MPFYFVLQEKNRALLRSLSLCFREEGAKQKKNENRENVFDSMKAFFVCGACGRRHVGKQPDKPRKLPVL